MNVRDLFSETPSGLGFSLRREEVSEYFKIDGESRVITPPTDFENFGVESDENSKRVWFEAPRIVDDEIDLSTLNLYVNYQNANGEKDKYPVTDVEVVDDKIYFSWLISRKATRYKGTLTFIVCAIKTNSKGEIETEWNTTLCTGTVLEGLEVDNPEVPEAESDLINQLIDVTKKSIKDVTDTCAQTIEELGTKEQEAINNIAEKETSSIDAVEKAKKDAVDYIGSGLDSTLTKQGIAAESQAVGDAILKARIVDKSSGELIPLSDSTEAPLQSMKIFGKTKQFTTTGKNKLPYPYTDTTNTASGITFTDNGDGSITANGTATSMADFRVFGANYDLKAFEEGEYIVSGCPSGGGITTYGIMICGLDEGSSTAYYHDIGDGNNLTVKQGTTIALVIRIRQGATLSNVTFYPMIRPVGTDATWEPYTGGIPSPNPNYPQALESVGGDGSVEQFVMGKNLFDVASHIANNHYSKIQVVGGKTIYRNRNIGVSALWVIYDISGNVLGNFETFGFTTSNPLVLPNDAAYIESTDKYSNAMANLYIGYSRDNAYEPYKSQSLTIPTPNGLPGIPVSSGGNYTDSNGQQYVCDEVDFGRGVYVQRTGEYRNTGEPMSMASAMVSSKNTKVIYWNHCLYNIKPHKLDIHKTIISNYFVNSYKYGSTEGYCSMISHSATYNGTYLYFSASVDTLEYGTTYTDAKTAISAWLAKTFSEDNPLIVRYPLAEPIETPLTEEEIQAYKALHTNYPNTTIYNSDGAGAEVRYVADTKRYIDNKIAQLAASSEV